MKPTEACREDEVSRRSDRIVVVARDARKTIVREFDPYAERTRDGDRLAAEVDLLQGVGAGERERVLEERHPRIRRLRRVVPDAQHDVLRLGGATEEKSHACEHGRNLHRHEARRGDLARDETRLERDGGAVQEAVVAQILREGSIRVRDGADHPIARDADGPGADPAETADEDEVAPRLNRAVVVACDARHTTDGELDSHPDRTADDRAVEEDLGECVVRRSQREAIREQMRAGLDGACRIVPDVQHDVAIRGSAAEEQTNALDLRRTRGRDQTHGGDLTFHEAGLETRIAARRPTVVRQLFGGGRRCHEHHRSSESEPRERRSNGHAPPSCGT